MRCGATEFATVAAVDQRERWLWWLCRLCRLCRLSKLLRVMLLGGTGGSELAGAGACSPPTAELVAVARGQDSPAPDAGGLLIRSVW